MSSPSIGSILDAMLTFNGVLYTVRWTDEHLFFRDEASLAWREVSALADHERHTLTLRRCEDVSPIG
jgi:hypothetical protein